MDKSIKQLLKNDLIILNTLSNISNIKTDRDNLYNKFTETEKLLNPRKEDKAYEASL